MMWCRVSVFVVCCRRIDDVVGVNVRLTNQFDAHVLWIFRSHQHHTSHTSHTSHHHTSHRDRDNNATTAKYYYIGEGHTPDD